MPAIAAGQPTSTPAMPPPSPPRQGSTAPTLIFRGWKIAFHCHRRMHTVLNVRRSNVGAGLPAIAAGQPASIPAMPPPSQPRRGSTAPTLILRVWRIAFHCHRRMHTVLNVRRSNVGAGLPAIAAGQPASIPAMPPPSQPRRGSTAPTLILRVWRIAFHCHRRMHTVLNVRRSNVGAGLPAIAAGQPASIPAMPPPSQPRQGSTAPTSILWVWRIAVQLPHLILIAATEGPHA